MSRSIGTLRKIASAAGRRLVVRFEGVGEREIGKLGKGWLGSVYLDFTEKLRLVEYNEGG